MIITTQIEKGNLSQLTVSFAIRRQRSPRITQVVERGDKVF